MAGDTRMAERLEDGGDELTLQHFVLKDPLVGEDHYLVRRHTVPVELWEHLLRLPPDLNQKEYEETPAEYRGLYEKRDSKWRMLPLYFEHWAVDGELAGMVESDLTSPENPAVSAKTIAAVEKAVLSSSQDPVPMVGDLQLPSSTAAANMIAAMHTQADKLIDTNLRELDELAIELSGLQVDIRSHRERLFRDIDELGRLTEQTIKARTKIGPVVKALADEYAAAAIRAPI